MSRPPLHVVAADEPVPAVAETVAARVRRLQAEAKAAANEAVEATLGRLSLAASDCSEIAALEIVSPGVRDALRQIGEQIETTIQTVSAINARSA